MRISAPSPRVHNPGLSLATGPPGLAGVGFVETKVKTN